MPDLREAAERILSCITKTETELGTEYTRNEDCVLGLLEPYEVAKAYLASHRADGGEAVDGDWLRSVGFLPDGEKGLARKIWERGQDVDNGEEPAMHILWEDESLWLESYGTGGETLCLLELLTEKTRQEVRNLCSALGITLKEGEA